MINIGSRIRKIRLQQRRTIQDIADGSGFSKSLISKIETGKVIPPVSTLMEIAKILHVKVSTLLDESENDGIHYTKKEQIFGDQMLKSSKGYNFHVFASNWPDKHFQPFYFIAEKGKIKKQSLFHKGEEFIFILKGKMRYSVGEKEFILEAGDSLYFESQNQHDLEPLSDKVEFIGIFSEGEKEIIKH